MYCIVFSWVSRRGGRGEQSTSTVPGPLLDPAFTSVSQRRRRFRQVDENYPSAVVEADALRETIDAHGCASRSEAVSDPRLVAGPLFGDS
jgi:hypothetical protein